MGALTSNRKRGIDYSSPSLPLRQPHSVLGADNPFPKKLKFTQSMSNSEVSNPQVSWKSAAVRLHQYPERLNPITRKVHAPVRNSKFGISRVSIGEANNRHHSAEFQAENYAMKYGKYEKSKTEAYGSLMYTLKGKEVIDIDYEEKVQEAVNVDVSEDLSVEEVEIVENGKERWRECDIKSMELDGDIRDRNIQPSCSSVVSEDITIANLKSESAGKVLDKVSTSQDFDIPRVPVHRKLYDSADKHNKKLAELNFQIELATKQLSTVRLYQTAKKPAKDVVTEPFVPLTDDEQNEVAVALSNAKRRKILVTHENSNIEITGELLQCLRPGAWLNDEIINLYLELLKEREKRNPQKFLKCHFFNTFFYKKLIGGRSGYDFKSVKRWTTQRKLGYCLVECDKIFVPVHKETHWCLAVINKKDEKFQYLDSLKGGDKQVMKVLARYFTDEVNDKVGKVIDVNSWKQEFVQDLPEQQNGYDCGVFMIKYADFYSRDVGLCFHQKHMPYFRLRTAKEILRLKAE